MKFINLYIYYKVFYFIFNKFLNKNEITKRMIIIKKKVDTYTIII